jgi:molecular chaperone DnaK (HSP70)
MAAIRASGVVRYVQFPGGDTFLDAYIYFNPASKEILFGKKAFDRMRLQPQQVFKDIKRYIGCSWAEVKGLVVGTDMEGRVVPSGDDRFVFRVTFDGTIFNLSPEQMTSFFFTFIKLQAAVTFSKQFTKVFVTFPAHFNYSQRQATIDSARLSGMSVLNTVTEPVAALYGIAKSIEGPVPKKVLVFDLGGGTFDVTVGDLSHWTDKQAITIVSYGGNTRLGSRDIDAILMKLIEGRLAEGTALGPKDRAVLEKVAREVKEELSSAFTTSVEFMDQMVTVTRQELDDAVEPIVMGVKAAIMKMLETFPGCMDGVRAGGLARALFGGSRRLTLVCAQVTHKAVVGGGSKLDTIPNRALEEYKLTPLDCEKSAAVCYGAAVMLSDNIKLVRCD